MKTYRIPIVHMAQKTGGGEYAVDLPRFLITSQSKGHALYCELQSLPSVLQGLIPQRLDVDMYADATGNEATYPANQPEKVSAMQCNIKPTAQKTEVGYYPEIEESIYKKGGYTLPQFDAYPTDEGELGVWYDFVGRSGKLNYDGSRGNVSWSTVISYPSNAPAINHVYENMQAVIDNGFVMYTGDWNIYVYSPASEHPPALIAYYEEGGLTVYPDSPSGYVDETETLRFAWHTTWVGFPVENIEQTSATLQWRNGTSGTVNSITISGNTTEYTMPANTLPKSQQIQWRVLAETVEGSAESSWRSLQTEDSYPTVKGISPAGTYIDGTDVVRFVWKYASDTGAPQKRYDLQYKTNTSDWIDLRSETSADAFSDVHAGVLPAGAIQWRVRGYNQDDIASAWSDPLSAIVISAPETPTVTITDISPRPTVSWTAIDQQAYQVRFGTYDTGTLFGTAKTMKSPVFLPDGRTSVYVRVMNLYGFWSPWGTASLTVANIPSETALNLSVSGTQDATLSWTEDPAAESYHIYRNGEKIAETNQTTYTDRYSIGQTSYFVRAVYSGNDYYTDSKTVAVNLTTDCPIITATDGDWVRLEYSTTSLPAVQIDSGQTIGMMTYNGTDYPVPELSPNRTRTYTLNAAFKDVSEALRFEALIGRVCCLKDQYGNRIIGMISNVTRAHSRFYTVCTATLNEIGGEVL